MNMTYVFGVQTMLESILWALVMVPLVEADESRTLQNPSSLAPLVSVDGDEYIRLRDELLWASSVDWDVDAASERSWELGVLGFILNNRRALKADFALWDAQVPTGFNIRGRWFKFRSPGSFDARIAFLLEKVLKPIIENDRKYALNDIRSIIGNGCCGFRDPHVAMWRAIWERCPTSELQGLSLLAMASSNDPSVLDIISEVLGDQDHPKARGLQPVFLLSLSRSTLPEVGDLVLAEWDTLKNRGSVAERAAAVLGASVNPQAHAKLYELALDPNVGRLLRKDAVEACAIRRQPGDREFLERFLRECKSMQLKRMVVRDLGKEYPLDWIRGPLRDSILTASDNQLVRSGVLAISQAITRNPKLRTQDVLGDLAVLEQAANRADLDETVCASIHFALQNLRERLVKRE